ncbi:MAG: class I SAM-dependent methyltransferase [Planctomycetaceae bacterium]|nr:class I SAM-dependent methyltransferase [Planctomycetaceae bacterium]
MKLSAKELKAMSSPLRQSMQKTEFETFQKFGFSAKDKDVLEIGCGAGFGATLISEDQPKSYVGIDVMEEQIALAKAKAIPDFTFQVQNAEELDNFDSESKDVIVIFGILHHVLGWRRVIQHVHRILRPSGVFFVEEPSRILIRTLDFFLRWGHDPAALFSLRELEKTLRENGFLISRRKKYATLFGVFRADKPETKSKC